MLNLAPTATDLQKARRFNSNSSQIILSEQNETIKNNMFLRGVINELEHAKAISSENLTLLKNVFSSLKNFKCYEKYLYEVTIAMGISHQPELVALAKEFNNILNERR